MEDLVVENAAALPLDIWAAEERVKIEAALVVMELENIMIGVDV